MTPIHPMTIEADNGEEVLLTCVEEACGRRLVLQRSGGMVVLDRGDFFASHTAGRLAPSVSISEGIERGAA